MGAARRSFGTALALAFALLLVLFAAALGLQLSRHLRTQTTDEITRSLLTQARLAALQAGAVKPADSPALARRLSEACRCRMTLIAADGRVLGDSEAALAELSHVENHAGRPEVAAALAGREASAIRHSATIDSDLAYAAVPAEGGRVARAALPLTEVRLRVAQLRRTIGKTVLGLLLAALTLALWTARRFSRPVVEMSAVARRLTEGDYSARVRGAGAGEHGDLGRALNSMAAALEDAFGELSRDKAQLSSILDNVVEAIVAVSAEGRIIALNPALCALFGVDGPRAIERPFIETLRHARLNELIGTVLKEPKPRLEEIALFTPEERVFEAHAVPLLEEGRPKGALLVLHDITRLRRLERHRRDFVANVSHELRTPLAAIRGFAETLREGAIDDKANRGEFLEAIEKETERLTSLVDDLLELSAIESGRRAQRLEALAPLEIARESASALRPLAGRRGISIEVAPGQAQAVSADRAELRRALDNLLDNAIKFNKDGGRVTVAARAEPGWVELSVADTGPGIPDEDLPRVFERFYRVDKARTRAAGGTGLGLAIVKHSVESMGGSVSVESRLGHGSTFRLRLPAA